ncbi:MAG: hypothetical protein HRT88_09710 [Lentisphaeraceae bacterium]|nr:hypothetical protein [Lentisphaeraceae bacterium]
MRCLNEYQLECLINKTAPLKNLFWRQHLKKCSLCQNKLEELKNNLSVQNDIQQLFNEDSKK